MTRNTLVLSVHLKRYGMNNVNKVVGIAFRKLLKVDIKIEYVYRHITVRKLKERNFYTCEIFIMIILILNYE